MEVAYNSGPSAFPTNPAENRSTADIRRHTPQSASILQKEREVPSSGVGNVLRRSQSRPSKPIPETEPFAQRSEFKPKSGTRPQTDHGTNNQPLRARRIGNVVRSEIVSYRSPGGDTN